MHADLIVRLIGMCYQHAHADIIHTCYFHGHKIPRFATC